MKLVLALVALCVTGVVYANHCTGNNTWGTSGGGGFVATYNDPKWATCVSAAGAGRHDSFESWVGAQYACQGTYPKPTGGSAYIRIYRCVKSTATSGYCTWADEVEGAPWGHQDNVSTAHSCVTCNAGFHWTGESACVLGNGDGCNYGAQDCETCGNPIHGATGNKYQKETDYTGRGPFALAFERSYNSFIGFSRASLGAGWRSNYDRVLKVRPYGSFGAPPYQWIVPDVKITATRADGKELTFTATVDSTTGYALADGAVLTAPAHARERLEKIAGGFRLHTPNDEVEVYSAAGKLQSITDRHGRTQALAYDAGGRLASVTDAFGKRIAFTHNAQGRLARMTDPAGGAFDYSYDSAGRLTQVTYPDATRRTYLYENASIAHLLTGIVDENGARFATWSYGALGRAVGSEHAGGAGRVTLTFNADGSTTELDALGRTRTLEFANVSGLLKLARSAVSCAGCSTASESLDRDAGGNVVARTDPNGNLTRHAYDARGLEESRTEGAGTAVERTIATHWHDAWRVPARVEEAGRATTFAYDAGGNLLTRTVTDTASGEARVTRWTYNALGQVLTVDGPRTDVLDVTTYTYYDCATGAACGQVRTVTNAHGHTTEFASYDDHGNPLEIVDPNGVTTTLTYDAHQRLKSQTVAGATTTYEYDGAGQLVRATLPGGARLDYSYDAAHRLVGVADALGNRIAYTLDAAGNRTAEQRFDPAGALKRAESRAYDALGRLRQVRNAAGEVLAEYGYDANGNRTREVADGSVTEYAPDALNRVAQTTDAASGAAQYRYDALDRLIAVSDPKGLVTSYVPDAFGDVVEQASPDTGATRFTHDPAGNRTSQTDARGVTVNYAYDALNRLAFVDYPGESQDVGYTYDSTSQPFGRGRLTGIVDASGTTALRYDARGNLVEERRVMAGRTYVTAYEHDGADRLVRVTYPSGQVVSYERATTGEVAGVLASAGVLAQGVSHLPFGPAYGYALGNGIDIARAHDLDYRLTEYEEGAAQHLRLYYDLRGNVEATEDLGDAARSQGFGYDALSRLASATGRYGAQAFTHDPVGNRLTASGDAYTYAADSQRLVSISDGTSFAYDAAGNVVARGGLTLGYDAAGRLEQVTRGTRRLGRYSYNAAGKRALKVAGEAGPDYLAMAEAADAQALVHRQEALTLEALASQREQDAGELFAYAAQLDQAASALTAEADKARAEAAAWLDQAQPDLAKAATWQQRADELRQAADTNPEHRDSLLRRAERAEAKAADYRAQAQPYLDQQQAALARAAEFDRQAGELLVEARTARDEAQRLTELAAAARAQAELEVAQAEAFEQQAGEYRRLAQEQQDDPPEVATYFVYEPGGALLGEYREDGSPIREYAWLDGAPLAMFAGGATYFFHNDHLGTPQKLTDAGRRVVWDASYEPFGRVELLTAEVEQPLRFAGQYFDAETGLHQNWYRDYDPVTGRYLQSDPIGLKGGLNTYTYVAGNPVKFVDPRGLDTAGCDGVPDWLETPCRLECCAAHDECFGKNQCTQSSWYSKCSKECDGCNSAVKKCLAACGWGGGKDDPAKPNYYCAKQQRYIKIPGDFPDYKSARAACESTPPKPTTEKTGKPRTPVPDPKEIFRGVS